MESPYIRLISRNRPQVRLFWFPFAGAGASVGAEFAAGLADSIEVVLLQLPGREDRLAEPPFTRMEPLVRVLTQVVRPYLDIPTAFFGHSAGAVLAFEVARLLARRAHDPPRLLLSGHRAAHLPARHPPIHDRPTGEFLDGVRALGAGSAALADPGLYPVLLPALRADFALWELYRYVPGAALATPMTVFGGDNDHIVPPEDLTGWQQHISGPFRVVVLPGNHFFINESRPALIDAISAELTVPEEACPP
jgi:surfactin synthase thioesterase subunit